ncbi:DUF4315 family protein [uncultured Dysosmobacter sp.]|uniref:DUF4315 family protein n=1 Tax=uncultured Dysosmobacter sp. TaxID=2591384 RepID=UPI0026319493|nr:DUF4315 family protein [uncultured Dysosmobacter sp.]
MAISKSAKIQAEMEKVKAKISDQQTKLKELEQKHREAQNEEIVDIVRGMNISLDELPGLLQTMKAGALGQSVPKSEAPEKEDMPE